MSSPMEYLLARALVEQRMREADQRRLANESRRSQQSSAATPQVKKTRRHSRAWGLVHVRRAAS